MLHHVVCMRFTEGVDDPRVPEIQAGLAALPGVIPELKQIDLGRDVVKSARSFDFALVAVFDDLAGLEVYRTHPAHLAVLERIKEVATEVVAVDFEG